MEMNQDMSEIFEIDTLDGENGTRNESVLLKSIDEWFLTIKITEQSIGSILEKMVLQEYILMDLAGLPKLIQI